MREDSLVPNQELIARIEQLVRFTVLRDINQMPDKVRALVLMASIEIGISVAIHSEVPLIGEENPTP